MTPSGWPPSQPWCSRSPSPRRTPSAHCPAASRRAQRSSPRPRRRRGGDADIASIGPVVGERARCRILMALDGGRALPASFLAAEAGLAGSTTSVPLSKLVAAGLLRVEASGRHRYYSLAGPEVGELLEVLTRIAPTRPVRSLSEDTRAARLREGRTCYDHLHRRDGVAIREGHVANRLIPGTGSAPDRRERHAAHARQPTYRA